MKRPIWIIFSLGLTLSAGACGRKHSDRPVRTDNAFSPTLTEKVSPVLADGASPDDAQCFVLGGIRSCTQEQMQRLSDPKTITVEKILRRSFVHQAWAGARLEQVFRSWPQELLPIASCATGIIVGNSVNPSHYSGGMIYIEPRYLAVTDEEMAILNNDPDPRNAALKKAPFIDMNIFAKSSTWLWRDSDKSAAEQRMLALSAYILVHELSHACDLNWLNDASHDKALSDTIGSLPNSIVTEYGNAYYHMKGFAQKLLNTPLESFLDILRSDESVMPYDYSSQYEHFADLSHVILIKYFFGVDSRTYFTDFYDANQPRETLEAKGGFFNKICAPKVWKKARAVVQAMEVFRADLIPEDPDCTFEESLETVHWLEYNTLSTRRLRDFLFRSADTSTYAAAGLEYTTTPAKWLVSQTMGPEMGIARSFFRRDLSTASPMR